VRVGNAHQITGERSAPGRRTVGYIRVSTEEQAEEGYSLADQERQCRAYAVARGWPEIAEVYADPGVSGATRDRPALRRLLADAKAGTVERVICTKLDRMSRRAVDLLTVEDELDQCGVERVYIKDSIDTSTPTGRLLRTVLAAVAELERDMILERTTSGKMEALRRGDVWRPNGLLGYRYVPVDRQNGTKARLEIDESTAPLVRRIFTEVASGVSLRALAYKLNDEGVPPVRGGRMWRNNAVHRIVTNSAYWGKATYGRLRRTKAGGKAVVRKGDPEKILYVDVPAIVTPELAQAALAAVARNKALSTRNTKHEYLLGGGLVRCGAVLDDGTVCGSIMHGEAHRGRSYRCSGQSPTASRRHSLPARALEDAVWNGLREAMLDPDRVLAEAQALSDESSVQTAALTQEIARLDGELAGVAAQLERLLDLYLAERLDADGYSAKAEALNERRLAILDQQATLAARRAAAMGHLLPIQEVKDACALIAERLDDLSYERRRHVVRTLVQTIRATREEAAIDGALDALTMSVPLEGDIAHTISVRYGIRPQPPPGRA
jgi:site-specific DNA recombinase